MPEGVDDKLGTVVDEYDRLKLLELEAGSSDSSSEDEEAQTRARNILDTLTPEEKAAAQKAALLRQYAYVDADPDDLAMSGLAIDGKTRDPNAPPPPVRGAVKGEEKAAEERRRAIEEALRLDGKKKKYKKNKEGKSVYPTAYSTGHSLVSVPSIQHQVPAGMTVKGPMLIGTRSEPPRPESQQGENAIHGQAREGVAKELGPTT